MASSTARLRTKSARAQSSSCRGTAGGGRCARVSCSCSNACCRRVPIDEVFLEAESDDVGCGGDVPLADKEAGAPRAAPPLQPVFGIEDAVDRTRLDDSEDEGSAAGPVSNQTAPEP